MGVHAGGPAIVVAEGRSAGSLPLGTQFSVIVGSFLGKQDPHLQDTLPRGPIFWFQGICLPQGEGCWSCEPLTGQVKKGFQTRVKPPKASGVWVLPCRRWESIGGSSLVFSKEVLWARSQDAPDVSMKGTLKGTAGDRCLRCPGGGGAWEQRGAPAAGRPVPRAWCSCCLISQTVAHSRGDCLLATAAFVECSLCGPSVPLPARVSGNA